MLLIPEGAFSLFLTSDRRCMVEFSWASQHPPYIVQVVTPSLTLTPSLTTLTPSLVTGRQGEEKQNSKSWYGSKSRYNYTTDKRSGTERHRRWQEGNGSMLFWWMGSDGGRRGKVNCWVASSSKNKNLRLQETRFVHEGNITDDSTLILFFPDGLKSPTID